MNNQFMRRSHVLLPTMPSGTTRNHRRAATATEARNSNPSGVRESNRVSTWLLRVSAILTLLLCGGMAVQAADPATPIVLKSTIPAEGASVEYVNEVILDFDLADVYALYPDVDKDSFGLMNSTKTVNLYKGDETTGEIIATTKIPAIVNTSANFAPGITTASFSFDKDIILETNQEYTIVIPTKSYYCGTATKKYTNTVITEPIIIHIRGAENTNSNLLYIGSTPSNGTLVENLNTCLFTFNQPVEVHDGAFAKLMEKDEILDEGLVVIAEDNPNQVAAIFNDVKLYSTHSYSVILPSNTVSAKNDPELKYKEIEVTIEGAGFKYFGYGRKYPANNKTIDYLSELQIAVDCSESQYLGRDFKPKATLYKVENDDLILVQENINCVVDESAKGFYIQVFDFDLAPSSTYQVVVEADTFHLWSYETQTSLKDTANEKLVLTYHTPEVIIPLPRQGFGVATPAEDSTVEKLEAFKLTFENYNFDGTFYYPVFAGYQEGYNVVKFIDETTGEEMGTFEVDIKWIGDQDFWLENVSPLDFTLLEGQTYKVVIPAGMFCCRYDVLHDLTLNEEFTVTYKGATSTTATVTCSYGEAFSIANVINRGEGTTIRFTPSEEWAVDTVTVNGEEAELTDGVLVLSDVTEDMNVSVSYKFIGGISFNYSTGVDGVEDDCPYFVALGESYVALSGLEIGSTVEVYNTVGMLLGTSVATDSEVKIDTVPGLAVVVIRKTDAAPVAITVRIP